MPVLEMFPTFSAPVATVGESGGAMDFGQATPVFYLPLLLTTGRAAIAKLTASSGNAQIVEAPWNQSLQGNIYTQMSGLAVGATNEQTTKLFALLLSSGAPLNIDLLLGVLNSAGTVTSFALGSNIVSGDYQGSTLQSRAGMTVTTFGASGANGPGIAVLWCGAYGASTLLVGRRVFLGTGGTSLGAYGPPIVLKTVDATLGNIAQFKALPLGSPAGHTWVTYVHEEKVKSFVWHTDDTRTTTWVSAIFVVGPGYVVSRTAMLADPLVPNAGWIAVASRHGVSGQGVVAVARITNIDSTTPTIFSLRWVSLGMNVIGYHLALSLGNAHTGTNDRIVLLYSAGRLTISQVALPLYRSVLSKDLLTSYVANEEVAVVAGGIGISSQLASLGNGIAASQYSGVPYVGVAAYKMVQNIGKIVLTAV